MIKCPFCKEEIQDDAVKCKHCGEYLNSKECHNDSHPIGKAREISFGIKPSFVTTAWKILTILGVFIFMLLAWNVKRMSHGSLELQCRSTGQIYMRNAAERDYSLPIGFIRIHWHWRYEYENSPGLGFSFSAPSGEGYVDLDRNQVDRYNTLVFPWPAIILFIAVAAFWWKFGHSYALRLFCRREATPICDELATKAVKTVTLRFDLKRLGLGGKIILGSAIAAILSLFLPWISMGIISSSGWNQQGYIFSLLFVYPVIGVFNVKGLNKIAGIICGALALVVTIGYIADKHYEIMGVTGNASGSGLYLFAASTIGLIVGAVKYRRPANR